MVRCNEQLLSQMLALKTSQQYRPMASRFEIPVIASAALLKEVILRSMSMVKTPSAMLSSMISVCFGGGVVIFQ
jgi:hypothetical protein